MLGDLKITCTEVNIYELLKRLGVSRRHYNNSIENTKCLVLPHTRRISAYTHENTHAVKHTYSKCKHT